MRLIQTLSKKPTALLKANMPVKDITVLAIGKKRRLFKKQPITLKELHYRAS